MANKTSSLGRRISWRLEAFAYDLVSLLLKPFSFEQISGFGGWLVRKIGPMTSKHKIARIGMETAFPDASEEQLNQWLDAQWDNTGRTFAEFPIMHRIKVMDENSRVTIKGKEILDDLIARNQPAIYVTGHFANWEVMAAVLTQYGVPVQITYRKINNPHIDKRVRDVRASYGTKLMVAKSGARGAKQILTSLREKEGVAIMNDQKFNEGLSLPFFGVNAMTAPGPTRLAMKAGAPLVPMSLVRSGAEFVMTIHEPIKLQDTGDTKADILDGVTQVTKFIEDRIREHPPQWFWVHRRWPKEHYRR